MSHSLIKECPLLVALNKEKTIYDGFISVQERDFRVRITLPSNHQLKQAKLHCCWEPKHLLKDHQHILKQRLEHSSDLVAFILELKTILEVALKIQPGWQSIPPPQYYSQLITEIESLGWDKLTFINTDFHTLKLKVEDSSHREHVFTVKLKSKYPAEAPECSADLPVPLLITWTPQSNLTHVHSQFLLIVEGLAEFWAVMDEIDEHTWVLEPEKTEPSGHDEKDCYCGNPLRSKLNANMHLWNPDCSVLQNMKDIMEIEFPSPATHEKSSFSVECGICYSYRLDSAIPDQVCNDPRCGQPFHQACLYEWLRGLPTSCQSFNLVFGECPYCSKPITVKMERQNL